MRTQNSIQENWSQFTPAGKEKSLKLVDVPGDERIRESMFAKHKESLK